MRLERGAVVLDSSRGRILEVEEEAASTLDLVFSDRDGGHPAAAAIRAGRAYRALQRELFEEPPSPHELDKGKLLLHCHDEPARWQGLPEPESADGALLTLGLVRRNEGDAVALAGDRDVVASVTTGFSAGAIPPREVYISGKTDIIVRTGANEELRMIELWTLEVGNRAGLTLVRLSTARSLVKLLLAAASRPHERELATLASCAERVPHSIAVLPRDLSSRTRAIQEYFRVAIP